MTARKQQILLGVVGGAASAVLTMWFRLYFPATDSFADIRDAPAILLAFFAGPWAAVIAGATAAIARAVVGLFGGVGAATWFASSLATFLATLVAVAARRWIFLGARPSFVLGALVAACVEMAHMTVVLTVGSAEYSNAFAVILAAIPFQCGGCAALVAVASLVLNRRQDGRENVYFGALTTVLITVLTITYFVMEQQVVAVSEGRLPITNNIILYPCNFATVLYGIVLSVMALAFAAYVKRRKTNGEGSASAARGRGFRVGLRGKFAISLTVMLGFVGVLIGTILAVHTRWQYELGYAESALAVGRVVANFIDGKRVCRYLETGEKDEYYADIRKLLMSYRGTQDIKYAFVIVPDERGGEYVWGTGTSPTGAEDDLGTREEFFDSDEIQAYGEVFRQERGDCCFIHRSATYGRLMSAALPILGPEGKPVALVCLDVSMDYVDERINQLVLAASLVTLAIILLSLSGYYFFVSRFIVTPAERQIEAEQMRIHAELDVARKIQAEDLPDAATAFPDRPEFALDALIDAAKEVGGDFYDFFLVDDSHLALTIGDVSDKGVPAALFMMKTRTLIRARAQRGGTPAEILRDVNDILVDGNGSGMFVTVYLAVINLRTGEGVSANAGHEHPVICRVGGTFEPVKYGHDPMLGLMPSLTYADRTFRLSPGDTLVVYTDGVPEARNAEGEQYGLKRMTAALGRAGAVGFNALLAGLRSDVRTFAGEAPQFDDITLLAVVFNGSGREGES